MKTITPKRILYLILAMFLVLALSGPAAARQVRQQDDIQGNPFIVHGDQDQDQRVSMDEFSGPDKVFDSLDVNGDGFIDEQEAPTGPPGNPVGVFDEDNDGKLSLDEFPGPDEHFSRFDKNGDGYLDETEAPQGPPPGQGGPMGRGPMGDMGSGSMGGMGRGPMGGMGGPSDGMGGMGGRGGGRF